jgi:hypothetical protein
MANYRTLQRMLETTCECSDTHQAKWRKLRMVSKHFCLKDYICYETYLNIYTKPTTQQISDRLITTFVSIEFIRYVKITRMFRLTWSHHQAIYYEYLKL